MTTGIRSDASGTFGALTFGGVDRIIFDGTTGYTTLKERLIVNVGVGGTALLALGRASDNLSQVLAYSNAGDSLYGAIQFNSVGGGSIVLAPQGASGSVTVTTPVGLGYGPGAGGTVTQATSKSTAVTLNKPSGKIAMAAGAIAPGAAIQFQLINSCITGGDTIDVVFASGISSIANYTISKYVNDAGGCYISLRNNSASSLDELIVLKFNVMKGANS